MDEKVFSAVLLDKTKALLYLVKIPPNSKKLYYNGSGRMAYFPGRQSSRAVVIRADPNTKFLLESLPYNPKPECFLLPAFGPGSRRPNLRENDQSTRKPNTGPEERTGRDKKESGPPTSPTLPGRFGNQGKGRKNGRTGWAGNGPK